MHYRNPNWWQDSSDGMRSLWVEKKRASDVEMMGACVVQKEEWGISITIWEPFNAQVRSARCRRKNICISVWGPRTWTPQLFSVGYTQRCFQARPALVGVPGMKQDCRRSRPFPFTFLKSMVEYGEEEYSSPCGRKVPCLLGDSSYHR